MINNKNWFVGCSVMVQKAKGGCPQNAIYWHLELNSPTKRNGVLLSNSGISWEIWVAIQFLMRFKLVPLYCDQQLYASLVQPTRWGRYHRPTNAFKVIYLSDSVHRTSVHENSDSVLSLIPSLGASWSGYETTWQVHVSIRATPPLLCSFSASRLRTHRRKKQANATLPRKYLATIITRLYCGGLWIFNTFYNCTLCM